MLLFFITLNLALADIAQLFAEPQFLGLVLGLFAPLAVSVLKQPGMSLFWQRVLAIAFSVVIGILTVASLGQLDTTNLLTTVLLVYAACETAYRALWKAKVSPAIEAATSATRRSNRVSYDDTSRDVV